MLFKVLPMGSSQGLVLDSRLGASPPASPRQLSPTRDSRPVAGGILKAIARAVADTLME